MNMARAAPGAPDGLRPLSGRPEKPRSGLAGPVNLGRVSHGATSSEWTAQRELTDESLLSLPPSAPAGTAWLRPHGPVGCCPPPRGRR